MQLGQSKPQHNCYLCWRHVSRMFIISKHSRNIIIIIELEIDPVPLPIITNHHHQHCKDNLGNHETPGFGVAWMSQIAPTTSQGLDQGLGVQHQLMKNSLQAMHSEEM